MDTNLNRDRRNRKKTTTEFSTLAYGKIPPQSRELEEAARIEGCGTFGVLWRVYVPLAKPVYLAYALVSVSHHWNNFLWPLVISNSVETRPLTVGLSVFAGTDQGIDWAIINAATLIASGPNQTSDRGSVTARAEGMATMETLSLDLSIDMVGILLKTSSRILPRYAGKGESGSCFTKTATDEGVSS